MLASRRLNGNDGNDGTALNPTSLGVFIAPRKSENVRGGRDACGGRRLETRANACRVGNWPEW